MQPNTIGSCDRCTRYVRTAVHTPGSSLFEPCGGWSPSMLGAMRHSRLHGNSLARRVYPHCFGTASSSPMNTYDQYLINNANNSTQRYSSMTYTLLIHSNMPHTHTHTHTRTRTHIYLLTCTDSRPMRYNCSVYMGDVLQCTEV